MIKQLPEIVDMNLPLEGVFHNIAVILLINATGACEKSYVCPMGNGADEFTKAIVVVDKWVDVQNLSGQYGEWGIMLTQNAIQWLLRALLMLEHASDIPAYGK